MSAAEAIDEGEACLDAPWYAFMEVIFPRSLSTLKGHILHWEVAAAADFVIAMALWSGPTGIVLSRLLYEHIRCMRSDGMTGTVLKRHERFLCAVIDSMYVLQVVRILRGWDSGSSWQYQSHSAHCCNHGARTHLEPLTRFYGRNLVPDVLREDHSSELERGDHA